eukprot:COSAG01_NODE_6220_length_3784_cov_1.767707_3_plen_49_part_00
MFVRIGLYSANSTSAFIHNNIVFIKIMKKTLKKVEGKGFRVFFISEES